MRTVTVDDEDARWLLVRRGALAVACALSGPVQLPLTGSVLLASSDGVALDGGTLQLPDESVAVVDVAE